MPPEILIEGLGDVASSVIGGDRTKLRASTGPSPQWSTMVLRDFGATRAQFAAGKRVTVRGGVAAAESDTSGQFADNRADAGTILNPPLGVTTVVADVSAYTAETEPTSLLDWWGGPIAFTAWIKVVLTKPATLRFDTYGSGMVDTVLAMFDEDGVDAPLVDINDDTQESVAPEDGVHSLLPDGGDGYTADGHSQVYEPGTYWLVVFPYAGDGWDTSEATIHLNITRSDAPPVIPVAWAGYVLKASRQFWFDVDDPETLHRRWVLTLVDVSTLFQKRVAFKQSDPGRVLGPVYKTDAYDDDLVAELVSNWLDLSTDDLDVTTLVERVGIVNPSVSCISGQAFYPWNGGTQWGDAMEAISQIPAAVYGLVPAEPLGSSPFARLLYADVDVEDAPIIFTDVPVIRGTPEVPAETLFSDSFARSTTSPDIGNGWTQNTDGTGTFGPGVIIHCDGSELVKGQTAPFADRATYSRSGVTFGAGYIQFEFYVPALADYAPFSQGFGAILDGSRTHPANVYVMPNFPADGRWIATVATDFGDVSGMGSGSGALFTPDPDNWYVLKAVITETAVGLKVWKLGDPEPAGYTFGPQDISGVSPFGEPDLSVSMLNGFGSSVDIKMRNLTVVADAIPATEDTPVENAGRYRECTIWDDGTDLVNEEFAWGAGKGTDHMVFAHVTDGDSIADHGLWQRGDTLFSVWCQETIDAVANTVVNGSPGSRRGHKRPVKAVDLVTFETGVRIGQKVRFLNDDYGVDVILPIRTTEITFPTPDVMKQTLRLSEALDRWGFEDPSPPFRSFTGPGSGTAVPPEPIFTIVCFSDIAPAEDVPDSWGDKWGNGHNVFFPGSFPSYPSGVTDQTYLGTPHVSGVNPPALFASGGVLWWTWEPVVSVEGTLATQGRTALVRDITAQLYQHVHAVFAVTLGSSDETGDIDDSMENSETSANNKGNIAWDAMVGLFIEGYSHDNGAFGVKLRGQTGASYQDRATHLSAWYEEPSVRFKVGAVSPMNVNGSGAGFVEPDTFPNLAGILTIDGDPTQVTATFVNVEDSSSSTETILAATDHDAAFGGAYSFNDEMLVAVIGGLAADGDGSFGRRAMSRHYAFSLVQSEFKLWNDDEPPAGVICGPVYSTDLTPIGTTPGVTQCETPTKTSATGYATAFAFQPDSLEVILNGLRQRPGTDYTVSGANLFDFTGTIDPTETVVVCYVTA